MNRKEISAVVILLAVSIGVTYFITSFVFQHKEIAATSKSPEGYVYLQTQTFHAFEVWQDNETLETNVNDTTTVLNVWFIVSYNSTSQQLDFNVWKSDVSNITTEEVYRSLNTSQTIQWAIENAEEIIGFHPGYYNLTNTLIFDRSNLALFGSGSTFICVESPTFNIQNGSYLQFSGFRFEEQVIP